MGVGVYYSTDGNSVLIKGSYWDDELSELENRDQSDFYYENLIENIEDSLPKSFCGKDCKGDRAIDDGGSVIAENGLFQVSILGWECDYAIIVHPLENEDFNSGYHPLALANLSKTSDYIFDRLAEIYGDGVRVRTSGYTTGTYLPTHLRNKQAA